MLALLRGVPRVGRWPRLLVAGTCLLLALASAVGSRSPAERPAAHTAPVVVAARALPVGHVLARDDVDVVRWPVAVRSAGTQANPSAIVGRRLAGPVGAGEPITGLRLIGPDLATALRRGLIAAAVPLGDPHAGDLVRAGDRIDLLETRRPPGPLAGAPVTAGTVRTVATRCLTLAVLPATALADAELVLAVDPETAAHITRDVATHVFTAVVAPP